MGTIKADFREKLERLDAKENSIKSIGTYMMFQKTNAKLIVETWEMVVLQEEKKEKLLPLLYAANEAIQLSRIANRGQPAVSTSDYVAVFAPILPNIMHYLYTKMVGDDKSLSKISHVIDVWQERRVYSAEFLAEVRRRLQYEGDPRKAKRAKPSSPPAPMPHTPSAQPKISPLSEIPAEPLTPPQSPRLNRSPDPTAESIYAARLAETKRKELKVVLDENLPSELLQMLKEDAVSMALVSACLGNRRPSEVLRVLDDIESFAAVCGDEIDKKNASIDSVNTYIESARNDIAALSELQSGFTFRKEPITSVRKVLQDMSRTPPPAAHAPQYPPVMVQQPPFYPPMPVPYMPMMNTLDQLISGAKLMPSSATESAQMGDERDDRDVDERQLEEEMAEKRRRVGPV